MSEEYNECATCVQQIEPEQTYCATCSQSLSIGSNYSGHEPEDFIPAHDQYQTAEPAATVRAVNMRRYLRVFCRSTRACIRTESACVIAELIDVSRSGLCFRTAEQFRAGTPVSVATHYIEGGENIFQTGQIVRVRCSPSGNIAEYGVEFFVNQQAARG